MTGCVSTWDGHEDRPTWQYESAKHGSVLGAQSFDGEKGHHRRGCCWHRSLGMHVAEREHTARSQGKVDSAWHTGSPPPGGTTHLLPRVQGSSFSHA